MRQSGCGHVPYGHPKTVTGSGAACPGVQAQRIARWLEQYRVPVSRQASRRERARVDQDVIEVKIARSINGSRGPAGGARHESDVLVRQARVGTVAVRAETSGAAFHCPPIRAALSQRAQLKSTDKRSPGRGLRCGDALKTKRRAHGK